MNTTEIERFRQDLRDILKEDGSKRHQKLVEKLGTVTYLWLGAAVVIAKP